VWIAAARHCPLCAAQLALADVEGRTRKRCPECGFVLFLNPASAAAGAVLDDAGRVLLVRRGIEPFKGCWALPAGYQEADEDPAAGLAREIREETGIEVEVTELIDLLFVPDDPRKPANVAVFRCRPTGGELHPGHDALEAAWFPLDALPRPLGFENNERILQRLQNPDGYPCLPWAPEGSQGHAPKRDTRPARASHEPPEAPEIHP
jgi:ADP-ribose pyrophosphatase YjhB (NUDIX family)